MSKMKNKGVETFLQFISARKASGLFFGIPENNITEKEYKRHGGCDCANNCDCCNVIKNYK